jgi:two-component system, sensor histidine kinase and response regulator
VTEILVIEDDLILLDQVVSILQHQGYTVRGTDSGKIGLQLAAEKPPEVMLCDIQLPDMEGYDILSSVRHTPSTSATPFIFMTARVSREDMRRGMELGADDYLTKPFTSEELLKAVETQLKKQEQLHEAYASRVQALRETLIHALPRELENPLNEIIYYADWIVDQAENVSPEDIRKTSETIDRLAYQMHRLTENYLGYVHLELMSTKPEWLESLQQRNVDDACPIVRSAIHVEARKANRDNDVIIQCESHALVLVAGDSLEKIVEEIINYAFQTSPPGVPIKVKTKLTEHHWLLSFHLQQVATTQERLARLAGKTNLQDYLYQQQAGQLEAGLMIAKRLTEVHGGQFSAEFAPDSSVTFQIQLRREG